MNAVRTALRQASSQLATLNRQVGAHLEMKDVDLGCLDLIALHGPLSPTQLADLAHLHPATVTGILDRLERGAWIERKRGDENRRAVLLRARATRTKEVYSALLPMNRAVSSICADYTDAELDLLAGFLHRVAEASRTAAPRADGEGELSSHASA